MRVLIALVGEQPTPNLIPLFAELPENRADCVQFMVSGDPRIGEVAGALEEAISKDPSLTGIEIAKRDNMNAWNLEDARSRCEHIIHKYQEAGHEVAVNLTGGTKIMSLAAYQAAVNCKVPMLYVNTEESVCIHFDEQGLPHSLDPFKVKIPIETQLRAAGREFKSSKPPTKPGDIPSERVEFAHELALRYGQVYNQLIHKIISNPDGVRCRPVKLEPTNNSREIARKAYDMNLWDWNQTAGTFTIKDNDAYKFLNGGWVEVYALVALANDSRFDGALGSVEIEGVEGEMDVIVSCNGRLGIVECKTKGPKNGGMTFAVAKIRLHEIVFGGSYSKAIYALPADIDHTQKRIFKQYNLPDPIYGNSLRNVANEVAKMLGA